MILWYNKTREFSICNYLGTEFYIKGNFCKFILNQTVFPGYHLTQNSQIGIVDP